MRSYGRDYSLKYDLTMTDLNFRVHSVMARELEVVRSQLKRNNVTMLCGAATFSDPHTIIVTSDTGVTTRVTAAHVLIACGTRPARTDAVPFDNKQIIDSDEILKLTTLPREMIVVGGGVIGLEYASMFSALGVRVCVVDSRDTLLDFADREMIDMLMQVMRHQNATFRLCDGLEEVHRDERGRVVARLTSNRIAKGDVLLYCVGRTTNADLLNLTAAGLAADVRGKISVNEHYQTTVPHIYAAGDVIGFPALAATSMEQGRHSACHMFNGAAIDASDGVVPYGIYTIPEISMVGAAEHSLVKERVPCETGLARFGELARAQMMGVDSGILKVLFHRETHKVLGIHAFGDSATELIHIGQTEWPSAARWPTSGTRCSTIPPSPKRTRSRVSMG